eukprot:CAMPEP_0176325682 /NCGR_PEP_ID=MMETSP0121_2-20121125/73537_1 /TAXON_ID=160619 /ORGANISM="Kryptoperidinium foliaceum, Strain CCMP 1326" /LENGTH=84 /DNA_ID=CAMNT_0017668257 /DNA_START=778 /DNA_END=1028 /DNA_ORIENTATION=-
MAAGDAQKLRPRDAQGLRLRDDGHHDFGLPLRDPVIPGQAVNHVPHPAEGLLEAQLLADRSDIVMLRIGARSNDYRFGYRFGYR